MKKNVMKRLTLGVVAGAAAIGLAACSATDGSDNTNDDTTQGSSVSGEDANTEDSASEDDPTKVPEQEQSGDSDVDQATAAVGTFYTQLFTVPVEGGLEAVAAAQEEMTLAVDGNTDVFAAQNPVESINQLPEDQQLSLIEVTQKYSGGLREATNYDDLSNAEKATLNMVTLIFRGGLSTNDTEGLDTSKISITVDPETVEIDGDTGTIPSAGILMSMPDQDGLVTSDNGVVTIDTPLVKSGGEWKVDGAEFINRLMSPAAGEAETQPAPAE